MTMALFFSLYCLEAGLFFLIVPWTRFWAANPLVQWLDASGVMMLSPWVRGFVSGVGAIHLILGAREMVTMLRWHRERHKPSSR